MLTLGMMKVEFEQINYQENVETELWKINSNFHETKKVNIKTVKR